MNEMQRILLVEDSPECQLLVKRALANTGVQVTVASTLSEAKRIFTQKPRADFDLILLDLVLPDGDGLTLMAEEQPEETPVFLLTSKGEVETKTQAFDFGVDDYLVKPINPVELKARVCARLKKVKHLRSNSTVVHKERLTLDIPLMRAMLREEKRQRDLNLTGKEFKILYFLIRHEGETLTRADLIKEVWGDDIHVLERTVDSHIAGLRRKLGAANAYVKSVPGAGYRFVSAPRVDRPTNH